MSKTPMLAFCALLILALAAHALANGTSAKGLSVSKVGGQIYKGGTAVLVDTEAHLTGCLRNIFGLFNPCLDLVKGCAGVALTPIEKPFDWLAKAAVRPRAAGKKESQGIPVPEKPKLPKK